MVLQNVQEKGLPRIQKAEHSAWSGEAVAFCPRCKAFQTVWFSGDKLLPTRKFVQEGNLIYHDCGSSQPCRLYLTL